MKALLMALLLSSPAIAAEDFKNPDGEPGNVGIEFTVAKTTHDNFVLTTFDLGGFTEIDVDEYRTVEVQGVRVRIIAPLAPRWTVSGWAGRSSFIDTDHRDAGAAAAGHWLAADVSEIGATMTLWWPVR